MSGGAFTVLVPDMHCGNCERRINNAIAGTAGLHSLRIDLTGRLLRVETSQDADPDSLRRNLFRALENLGFSPQRPESEQEQTRMLLRLGVSGLAGMQVMMLAIALYAGEWSQTYRMDIAQQRLLEFASLMFCLPIVGYAALPFFRNAGRSLLTWQHGLSMDVPIALAIAVAFSASTINTLSGSGAVYFDSVAMFTFLLLLARFIAAALQQKIDPGINVSAMLPTSVPVKTGAVDYELRRPQDLVPGDILSINAGDLFPTDGLITSGETRADESLMTGESIWHRKTVGDAVIGGSINTGQPVLMKVTHRLEDSTLVEIDRLTAAAAAADLPPSALQALSNKIGSLLVVAVLALATLTAIYCAIAAPDDLVNRTLAVLVVTCPCALSLAMPTAISAALLRLRKLGISVTNLEALLRLPQTTLCLFDKTGTLTMGKPVVSHCFTTGHMSEKQVMAIACALEQHSSHPIARAFTASVKKKSDATEHSIDLSAYEIFEHTGQGVVARPTHATAADDRTAESRLPELRIGSAAFCDLETSGAALPNSASVFLTVDSLLVAAFEISDPRREGLQDMLDYLTGSGRRAELISGDTAQACAPYEALLRVQSTMTPQAKMAYLQSYMTSADNQHARDKRERQEQLLMMGDGLNDLPTLAGAPVSVAPADASDLVRRHSDIVINNPSLRVVPELFELAKILKTTVHRNFAWALSYNAIGVPLAMLGYIHPWTAALGMSLSSLLVTVNSLQLTRRGNLTAAAYPQHHNQLRSQAI